jgi:hypothetical protein
MNQDIFVVIEHLQGEVLDISYAMLAAARDLSKSTGGQVVGVLLGHNAKALADTLNGIRSFTSTIQLWKNSIQTPIFQCFPM